MFSSQSFRDKNGEIVWLSPSTAQHIKDKHGIANPAGFVSDTLREPVAILRSKWEADTRIYFKRHGHLYKAVVVSWIQRRIKTAHLIRAVEGGEVLWRLSNSSV